MKKINVILAALTLFGLMTGCNSNNTNTSATDETQTVAEITMTLAPKYKNCELEVKIGGNGAITIDWGDGSPVDTLTIDPPLVERIIIGNGEVKRLMVPEATAPYKHNYALSGEYTVKITGDDITELYCFNNELTTLDVSKYPTLKKLTCFITPLSTLDLSKNTALEELECNSCQLTSLDLSKNTALKQLECKSNQLTTLDLSKNTALESLSCKGNQLTSLDLSKNTALIYLNCSNNKLTALDVSQNTALTELYCHHNELTSLDLSNNTALTEMWCLENNLSAAALNALFRSLCSSDSYKKIHVWDNPGAGACDRSIAEKKQWWVDDVGD